MSSSTRWLAGIAAAVAAVIVLSVVVAIVAGGEEDLRPGTPEAAVQGYLRAIRDGDIDRATGHLTDELRARCDAEQLRRSYRSRRDFSARIGDITQRDTVTEVEVRITEGQGAPPFGGGGYSHDERFVLARQGDQWRIADPPWPLFICPTPPQATPARAVPSS
jgi:hypothetical protein